MQLRAVRGMKDILPEQAVQWHRLEDTFRALARLYGYGEVRTPLIEPTELFVRQVGEGTDIVDKEMYSFEHHGEALTVRPEGTAGAARAYVQHAVAGREPVSRWYYIGPMFRAERPAKGRYRQFFQAGCEIFGDPGPVCDAELIHMCGELMRQVGIDAFEIHVNSIGSKRTQQRYREALVSYFTPLMASLSEDSQRRLGTNPLRILDSKAPEDQALVPGAPSVLDVLDDEDRAHLDELLGHLDLLGQPYVVDPTLVRGLDYYTRTLFELRTTTGDLGAQSALLGGGRYDDMVESLGNKKGVPAIGFAMGLERILTLMAPPPPPPGPDCYVMPMVPAAHGPALVLATRARAAGLSCEVDGRRNSVKSMMRRANTMQSRLAVLLGDDELARGVATVKDLVHREQAVVPLEDAPSWMAGRLEAHPTSTAPGTTSSVHGGTGADHGA